MGVGEGATSLPERALLRERSLLDRYPRCRMFESSWFSGHVLILNAPFRGFERSLPLRGVGVPGPRASGREVRVVWHPVRVIHSSVALKELYVLFKLNS